MYRPPSYSQQQSLDFMNFLRSRLNFVSNDLILGDFNFPGIDWNNLSSRNSTETLFIDILDEINCHQLISQPTSEHLSILDLCLCSNPRLVIKVHVGDTFSTSDHSTIICDLDFEIFSDSPLIVRSFAHVDWELLRMHLTVTDWEDIFNGSSDIIEIWLNFKRQINYLTDIYVPKIQANKNNLPWANQRLKSMFRTKKRKWRKYLRSKCYRHLVEYRNFAKMLKQKVHYEQCKYENLKFKNKNKNPKAFFNYIKNRT